MKICSDHIRTAQGRQWRKNKIKGTLCQPQDRAAFGTKLLSREVAPRQPLESLGTLFYTQHRSTQVVSTTTFGQGYTLQRQRAN